MIDSDLTSDSVGCFVIDSATIRFVTHMDVGDDEIDDAGRRTRVLWGDS
jgi:hypothetical protein